MRKHLSRIVRIAVSAGLIGAVIAFSDWRAVWKVLRSVNLLWVGCALALALADRFIINVRYDVFLAARNIKVGFGWLFRVQLAANFLGSFLPGFVGVDAVRIAALCRSGQPTATVVAATLVDRFSLAVATLVFGSVTVLALATTRIPGRITEFVLVATAATLLLMMACLHPAVRAWAHTSLVPRIPERFRHTVSTILGAVMSYRHDRWAMAWTTVITVALLLLRIAFAKSLAYACGVDVSFVDLLLVIPILWIVVMLPITIGGIGVQDAGYVVLMSLIGVGPSIAFSMSILEHVVARLASSPGVLFLGDITTRGSANVASEVRSP